MPDGMGTMYSAGMQTILQLPSLDGGKCIKRWRCPPLVCTANLARNMEETAMHSCLLEDLGALLMLPGMPEPLEGFRALALNPAFTLNHLPFIGAPYDDFL